MSNMIYINILVENNATTYVRGCGYIHQGIDICKFLEKVKKVSYCKSCETDYCNKINTETYSIDDNTLE